jgi:hypothetical protein
MSKFKIVEGVSGGVGFFFLKNCLNDFLAEVPSPEFF